MIRDTILGVSRGRQRAYCGTVWLHACHLSLLQVS
jgi:hypothetical protein